MRTFEHKYLPYPQTRKSAHSYFRENGIVVSHWARDMGLTREVVVDLLHGRLQGHRGNAHKAAIALGLKKEPRE